MSNSVYEKLKRQNLCHRAEEKGEYVALFQDFFTNTKKGDLSGSHTSVYGQYSRFLDVALKHLKQSMKDGSNLELLTLCPCPPETSDTAAIGSTDDLDGGIFSIVQRLKQIREEINQLNGSAFKKSLLTDKQHYQLLDVDMFLADFIARSLPASKGVE